MILNCTHSTACLRTAGEATWLVILPVKIRSNEVTASHRQKWSLGSDLQATAAVNLLFSSELAEGLESTKHHKNEDRRDAEVGASLETWRRLAHQGSALFGAPSEQALSGLDGFLLASHSY